MSNNYKIMDKVILNETDLLVSPLADYFTKNNAFTIASDKEFDVGVVEHVGGKIDDSWVGKIIYYHSKMATKITLKGIGVYELLPDHSKLLIRADQNKDNY